MNKKQFANKKNYIYMDELTKVDKICIVRICKYMPLLWCGQKTKPANKSHIERKVLYMMLKNSPAIYMNKFSVTAGMAIGSAVATLMSVGMAFADSTGDTIETKVTEVITGLFKNVQGIAGPLFGLAALVCIVACVVSVLNGNPQGIRTWRTSLIVVLVLLALIYMVPTLVQWAASFGNDINSGVSIGSAFDGYGE